MDTIALETNMSTNIQLVNDLINIYEKISIVANCFIYLNSKKVCYIIFPVILCIKYILHFEVKPV